MEDTVKIIGYSLGIVVAMHGIMAVLPYLLAFLALCGAWYLFQEYNNKQW